MLCFNIEPVVTILQIAFKHYKGLNNKINIKATKDSNLDSKLKCLYISKLVTTKLVTGYTQIFLVDSIFPNKINLVYVGVKQISVIVHIVSKSMV